MRSLCKDGSVMKAAKVKSPPENKHQVKTAATRADLLVAAEAVFVRDGYERAQIEEIARQAGRTRGAVYAHFKDKEDIFLALLETKAEGRLDSYLRDAPSVSFEERVNTGRRLFLDTVQEESWPVLMLEFKLFALRNRGSLERIQGIHTILYEDVRRELLTEEFGFTEREKDRALIGLAVLKSLPGAIALERQFNPLMGSKELLRDVLEAIFLTLVEINHPGPGRTSEERHAAGGTDA